MTFLIVLKVVPELLTKSPNSINSHFLQLLVEDLENPIQNVPPLLTYQWIGILQVDNILRKSD